MNGCDNPLCPGNHAPCSEILEPKGHVSTYEDYLARMAAYHFSPLYTREGWERIHVKSS